MAKNNLDQARQLIKKCRATQNPYLDLGHCGITNLNDLPELFECIHLETLILGNDWWSFEKKDLLTSSKTGPKNVLNSIPLEIGKMENLVNLSINGNGGPNGISDIHFLEKLTGLQSLDLGYNQISEIRGLETLTALQSLYLGDNQISKIRGLETLTALQSLDLRLNQISEIRGLETLTALQSLDLGYNKISEIRGLGTLTALQYLFLNSNQISEIQGLETLTALQSLYLGDNKISAIRGLETLTALQSLDLGDNQISKIRGLETLTALQSLDLSDNKISEIRGLETLTALQDLDLRANQISEIRDLETLTALQSLDLSDSQIKEIPAAVFQLNLEINLKEFDFSGLMLYNNPIESPPREILKQGRQSVLAWFEANKVKLNEIKIILIGDPKAGKTSLLRRLKDNSFSKKEVQTDGVNIEDIPFGKCKTFIKQTSLHQLTGHFWDFGGQEIMNATHQFFLTNRSVYILVLDARKDANVSGQIRNWLKRVTTTGGDSPIIVVANQIDINTGFGFENEYELQQEFPQVKCFIKASCETKENIDFIKDKLAKIIPQSEFFNSTKIDERWIPLKDELQKETRSKRYLNEDRFSEICHECKLDKKPEQDSAITFLHDLGLVLHFDKVKRYDYYVLDPLWITYGVYQILTSAYAGTNNGIVEMDKLEYIVNEEEDKKERYRTTHEEKIEYTRVQCLFLVEILNQFKLCFRLPDDSRFILPDLLATKEPTEITEPIRKATDSIRFVYDYDYLPNSIMPRIIVETHKIYEKIWRTGCVLGCNGCKALITDYENKISIIVTGTHKKKWEFMSVIRFLIDSINQELSNKPDMLIPLPGINAFADYEELLDRQKNGETYFTLYKPAKKKFEISMLLEGVASQDEVRKISKKLDKLLDKTDTIIDKLDEHYDYLINMPGNTEIKDDILNAINAINATQSEEITEELMQGLSDAFAQSTGNYDRKLDEIHADLKKTDNVKTKLKLCVPLISLIGINLELETEFDIKAWAKKMYKKYKLPIFNQIVFARAQDLSRFNR